MVSMVKQSEQDFIIGAIGGSLVPNSTHRPQDVIVGLLSGMRTLEESARTAGRRNLAGEVSDAFASLAEDHPMVLTDQGDPLPMVVEQANAAVGDHTLIVWLALPDALNAIADVFGDILGRRGDCYLESADGWGVYADDPDEDPDWY